MPEITGPVNINGDTIGDIVVQYIDDARNASRQETAERILEIIVETDREELARTVATYSDIIAYNGGGKRTITLEYPIMLDDTETGKINIELVDRYGKIQETSGINPMIILALLLLGMILLGEKKR